MLIRSSSSPHNRARDVLLVLYLASKRVLNPEDEAGSTRTPLCLGIRGVGCLLDCKEERRSLPPDPHPCDQVRILLLVLLDTMEYVA